jgi:Ca-activated chloride channel family protein
MIRPNWLRVLGLAALGLGGLGPALACSAESDASSYGAGSTRGTAGGATPSASVGTGGGQDFAAFRQALDQMRIPSPNSLDEAGFFAEHYTSLPPATCDQTLCLHGMLSVSPDNVRGGQWTLLQMGMNSPIDPSTVTKPPLDLVVVLDRSGSMADAGKMTYAKQGIDLLVDALTEADTLTLVAFDSTATTLYGPARVSDPARVKTIVDGIQPGSNTDIYDGLQLGYQAALSAGDETQARRVIFLTDGLATAGITDRAAIETMSASYNAEYIGLTTIGLGSDADSTLLRQLSEQGGGNFYFVEDPAAVTEVFTEELAFFVAPIAYDLQITFNELPSYKIKQVYGTSLWAPGPTGGGQLSIPSAFLVSRTSAAPDATGGRRGGGAAIIAELTATPLHPATGPCDVASLHLRYRLPGTTTFQDQDVAVGYDVDDAPPTGTAGYYSSRDIEKNTIILGLFVAFSDATAMAQLDPAAARTLLAAYQPTFLASLAGWADQDLLDDVGILQEYLDVLAAAAR